MNREAGRLRDEGLSYREIGVRLGISTERARMAWAREERLRRRYPTPELRASHDAMMRDHEEWREGGRKYRELLGDLPSGLRNALVGVFKQRSGWEWDAADKFWWRYPTLEEIRSLTDAELLAGENFGKKSLARLRAWLAEH